MKKFLIIGAGLIVLGVMFVLVRSRKGTEQAPASAADPHVQAVDTYLSSHPAEPAAPELRRLSSAIKAEPRIQNSALSKAAAGSVSDGKVSAQETVMLQEAAALADRGDVTEQDLQAFEAKYPQASGSEQALSVPNNRAVSTIDTFVKKNPSGPGAAPLRRLSAAHKTRPDHVQPLADTAADRIEDGSVSKDDELVLEKAAALAERPDATPAEVKAFSEKYSPAQPPSANRASSTPAARTIDRYIEKNSSGRSVPHLRRLSAAMKTRPEHAQPLAETVASRLEDGSISKEDAVVIEKAAAMVEQEGLSPQQMAEFSTKYMTGAGLSQKPVSAPLKPKAASVPQMSFEGKRQVNYTFSGTAKCAGKPCTNIEMRVRVSSGKWVETRQDEADDQGRYNLQMPVLSLTNEKVKWSLEAYSKDLRKAELSGERMTTGADRDITLQNNLDLKPS